MIPVPDGLHLGSPAPQSEEWHELRSEGIGASEVAAILGLSPWESAFSLWHAKRAGWRSEETPEMFWGTRKEPLIRDVFAERHGAVVAPGVYRHRTHPHWRCSPDGFRVDLVEDGGDDEPRRTHLLAVAGLEVKTAERGDDWGPDGTDEIPIYYRTQVMWCMVVTGLRRWHVAALIGASDYREYLVEYDEADAAILREHVERFWQSLVADVAPDLDGHGSTLRTVRRLHPEIDGTTVALDTDLLAGWASSKATLCAAETEHQAATARLLDAMGTARRATDGDAVRARRQPTGRGSIALHSTSTKTAAKRIPAPRRPLS